jgi:hypothetical protein
MLSYSQGSVDEELELNLASISLLSEKKSPFENNEILFITLSVLYLMAFGKRV